jgi:hypothetical protein
MPNGIPRGRLSRDVLRKLDAIPRHALESSAATLPCQRAPMPWQSGAVAL